MLREGATRRRSGPGVSWEPASDRCGASGRFDTVLLAVIDSSASSISHRGSRHRRHRSAGGCVAVTTVVVLPPFPAIIVLVLAASDLARSWQVPMPLFAARTRSDDVAVVPD